MKKMNIFYRTAGRVILWGGVLMGMVSSCKYLDVVPDDVPTIDNAFALRSQAEKYLFTCYSYLPNFGSWAANPALLSGDEIWFYYPYASAHYAPPPSNWEIARGNQNIIDPYLNYWDGSEGGQPLFEGIRTCNTFLDNINRVPDMENSEKQEWSAEVKFLKAYYHWYLLRMYGPIPIVDQNLPVSADPEEVKVYREPVDSCFNYIVNLLDSAANELPDVIQNPVDQMGRITRPIALAIKARVLMTAASPLFNGNPDYVNYVDNKGRQLFNPNPDPQKWQRAADACLEAIDECQSLGYQLYHFNPSVASYKIGPEIQVQMDIRNAITEKWNTEIIWGGTNSMASSIQKYAQPIIDPTAASNPASGPIGVYAPTMRMAELFYTHNGVPIDEDKTWDYAGRYGLDTAKPSDIFRIQPGYVTAALHFNREPRFYADLGFDGGVWYGQGAFDDSATWHVEGLLGHYSGQTRGDSYSITGYYAKKLVNFLNVQQPSGAYSVQAYPWPIIRLADLYLYYSEALNEVGGPGPEALKWIDLVRARAGIPSVEEAWTQYANHPDTYTTKDGFRQIIHQERLIEMAFEGNRFWDLRRWKQSAQQMTGPIRGWNIGQSKTENYYHPTVLFDQTYPEKYYFWPVEEHDLITNSNLLQSPGW
jgi:hypothetical protein